MTTEQMIEEAVSELKKIMGDKYYEGAETDFTAENIIDLFRKYLSTIATKSAERAVLDYILSLGWQDTENEYVKEVLNDAEEIAKSLYQKDINE